MSDLILSHTMRDNGNTLQITATGRLVIDTAAELQRLLLEQTGQADTIQLDLSALDDIDLAGLQVICSACRTNLDTHHHFNFTGCMNSGVQKIIGNAGLHRQATCKHNADLPCIWCGGMN
jgi:anti-anti-sigma factor